MSGSKRKHTATKSFSRVHQEFTDGVSYYPHGELSAVSIARDIAGKRNKQLTCT